MLKVLLVAPRTNLPTVDLEVQNVLRSGLDVTPLLGKITRQNLITEMQKSYDILWFATHASADGNILLGDELINASELVPLIGDLFRLVYINTCSSQAIAQQIQNGTGCAIICTINDVQDVLAYQTGSLFARELANGKSFQAAYKSSMPGANSNYVFLGSLRDTSIQQKAEVKKLDVEQHELFRDLNSLTIIIAKLDATLNAELIILRRRVDVLEDLAKHTSENQISKQQVEWIVRLLFIIATTLIVSGAYFYFAR